MSSAVESNATRERPMTLITQASTRAAWPSDSTAAGAPVVGLPTTERRGSRTPRGLWGRLLGASLMCCALSACAVRSTVVVEEPSGAGDWYQMIGDERVHIRAQPGLGEQADATFAVLSGLAADGVAIVAGLRFPLGWTTLTLARRDGELYVLEPNYRERDPEAQRRRDLTATLEVWRDQRSLLSHVQVAAAPVNFDEEVLVIKGALEQPRVYMGRVPSPGGRLSGWRIAPTVGDITDSEIDYMTIHAIYRARPALLQVMLLPPGYLAFFDGNRLEALLDPQDREIALPPSKTE